MAKRILIVITSHDLMGLSGKKTGNWFDEVATPYYTLSRNAVSKSSLPLHKVAAAANRSPFSYDNAFTTSNTERYEKDRPRSAL